MPSKSVTEKQVCAVPCCKALSLSSVQIASSPQGTKSRGDQPVTDQAFFSVWSLRLHWTLWVHKQVRQLSAFIGSAHCAWRVSSLLTVVWIVLLMLHIMVTLPTWASPGSLELSSLMVFQGLNSLGIQNPVCLPRMFFEPSVGWISAFLSDLCDV